MMLASFAYTGPLLMNRRSNDDHDGTPQGNVKRVRTPSVPGLFRHGAADKSGYKYWEQNRLPGAWRSGHWDSFPISFSA